MIILNLNIKVDINLTKEKKYEKKQENSITMMFHQKFFEEIL